jgi:flagellar L-ring protein precursor FlgH
MNTIVRGIALGVIGFSWCLPANAADLYHPGEWSALATDRNASRVGDTLTILIYESATATNSASNNSDRSSHFGGQISADTVFNHGGNLSLNSGSDNTGSTDRSGGMVAQISAVVDGVLPNGDLHITGAQALNINGEKTNIKVAGRVRRADISPSNTVLSSRLADAAIDYDGSGFVSRSSQPGLLTRVFNWLGIL